MKKKTLSLVYGSFIYYSYLFMLQALSTQGKNCRWAISVDRCTSKTKRLIKAVWNQCSYTIFVSPLLWHLTVLYVLRALTTFAWFQTYNSIMQSEPKSNHVHNVDATQRGSGLWWARIVCLGSRLEEEGPEGRGRGGKGEGVEDLTKKNYV